MHHVAFWVLWRNIANGCYLMELTFKGGAQSYELSLVHYMYLIKNELIDQSIQSRVIRTGRKDEKEGMVNFGNPHRRGGS